MMTQISPGIIRIWMEEGEFRRNNPSFAVENEDSESSENVNFSEQANSFEIYTGELIIRIIKLPFQIRVYDKYQKLLLEDLPGKAFNKVTEKISTYKALRPGERIYGLGEKNGNLNRVGSHFTMWNSDKPCYDVNEDPLYKSIPFFMSSAGYGIYFDNTFKTGFDFGLEDQNAYSFSAPGGEMMYYFIFGPTYKQIISRYIQLTGKAIMPPSWALGFAQCRGLLTNEKLTREIAKGYRDRQIPCDIIYQDIGWTEYLQDFEWRKDRYENPVKMIADLQSQGFKVIVSQDPVISQTNKKQWKEADSLAYFATDIRNGKTYDMPWPWGGNCGVVDFTHPEAADWWGNYQQKPISIGVKGFWTDMGEPAWSNEESTDRLFMKHYLGMHAEIHNVYGLNWDRVVCEQFEKHNPNQRIFQMTRSAFAGMQRYTFGWSGDSGNGNDVLDGWKQLEQQIPIGLSAGMGGIPFWSCDISGYCGDIKDYEAMSELYVRWLQFGAFNPLSRIHHEGNNAVEPWLFGQEAENICRQAIELKYRLFPYIYSYARQAFDSGLPLIRACMLEYPDDPECYNLGTQFFFGSELLIATVMEQAAVKKRIYLPEGEWIDYNQPSNIFHGKQWIDYPVTLETLPVFVKQGSIIAQMPVMQYIGENTNYPLILDVFPASTNRKAQFEIYEDDGETNNYKQNIYAKRLVQCQSKKELLEINYTEKSENNYQMVERDLIFQLHLNTVPEAVLFSDKKVRSSKVKSETNWSLEKINKFGWSWNNKNGILTIFVPSALRNEKIIVQTGK
jgi:alpha-glucosidase